MSSDRESIELRELANPNQNQKLALVWRLRKSAVAVRNLKIDLVGSGAFESRCEKFIENDANSEPRFLKNLFWKMSFFEHFFKNRILNFYFLPLKSAALWLIPSRVILLFGVAAFANFCLEKRCRACKQRFSFQHNQDQVFILSGTRDMIDPFLRAGSSRLKRTL